MEFSLSFKYGQVRKSLPFGCILREWEKGRLVETCPQCGGPLYVYRSFAQFLEGGRQQWSGYCPFCEVETHGNDLDRVTRFRNEMAQALETWGLHIRKTDDRSPQQFDEPSVEISDTLARLSFRGMSLLAHAVKGENLPAAQLLIEYGAEKDEEGFPELEAVLREVLACGEGDFGQHLMLEALLGVALRRLEERFRGE